MPRPTGEVCSVPMPRARRRSRRSCATAITPRRSPAGRPRMPGTQRLHDADPARSRSSAPGPDPRKGRTRGTPRCGTGQADGDDRHQVARWAASIEVSVSSPPLRRATTTRSPRLATSPRSRSYRSRQIRRSRFRRGRPRFDLPNRRTARPGRPRFGIAAPASGADPVDDGRVDATVVDHLRPARAARCRSANGLPLGGVEIRRSDASTQGKEPAADSSAMNQADSTVS